MKTAKTWFFIVIMLAGLEPHRAFAGQGVYVDAGPGVIQSLDTGAVALRYDIDTEPSWKMDGFYEAAIVHWGGKNHSTDYAVARGLLWNAPDDTYVSGALGLSAIDRQTHNLGTPLQFYIRAAWGRRIGDLDVSLGYIHISNGKLFFGWSGPNNGANFVTLSLGKRF